MKIIYLYRKFIHNNNIFRLPYLWIWRYAIWWFAFTINNKTISAVWCIIVSLIQLNKAQFLIGLKPDPSILKLVIQWMNIMENSLWSICLLLVWYNYNKILCLIPSNFREKNFYLNKNTVNFNFFLFFLNSKTSLI